jgi:hypothetical protein
MGSFLGREMYSDIGEAVTVPTSILIQPPLISPIRFKDEPNAVFSVVAPRQPRLASRLTSSSSGSVPSGLSKLIWPR